MLLLSSDLEMKVWKALYKKPSSKLRVRFFWENPKTDF